MTSQRRAEGDAAVTYHLSDYLYDLPPALIAQKPADRRDESRMMVLRRAAHTVTDTTFGAILDVLGAGDLLVTNDTRVIPARLFGRKIGGESRIEILLLRRRDDGHWKAMVRPGRRLRPGTAVRLEDGAEARIIAVEDDGTRIVALHTDEPWPAYLDRHGITPLPPYIERHSRENEAFHRQRYQTVYAADPGSVAAPTAGLHFTPAILDALRSRGVETASVTLHVGMGTFRPVQVEDIRAHRMDAEVYTIRPDTAAAIERARSEGGRIIAVGTTTTRTLEYVSGRHGGRVVAGSGQADLFIYPGYEFRVVNGLLTNFHLPGSTLLMLVSALAGREWVLECYRHAVDAEYRFYSYGDCMLIV